MLEDAFADIVGKARWGKSLSVGSLAAASGIAPERLSSLEAGSPPTPGEVGAVAGPLGLGASRLRAIAENTWEPGPLPPWGKERVRSILGHIGSYPVWGYLFVDDATAEAALIDTAYDPQAVLRCLERERLRLVLILLTHAHADHIGGMEQIHRATGAAVYLDPQEKATLGGSLPKESRPIREGSAFSVGRFSIRPLSTPGHTSGGTSFLSEEPGRPLAFVGDALFAGSVGRSRSPQSYPVLLEGIHKNLLSLPGDCVFFPGHGPATTAGEERAHNPFFP